MAQDANVPQDDEGVKTSQVIDICEKIITKCWNDFFAQGDEISDAEIDKMDKLLYLVREAHTTATDAILQGRRVDVAMRSDDFDNEDYDNEEYQE